MKVTSLVCFTLASVGLLLIGSADHWQAPAPDTLDAAGVLVGISPSPAAHALVPAISPKELTAVVQRTCVVCHNDQLMTGNLTLQSFNVENAGERSETAEKMIGKLRAGMMPPPGIPRPGGDTLLALVETLESSMQEYWSDRPNPGARPFQRLNRREYERAIRDVLGLTIDAGEWLPLDQYLANFDNMGMVQDMSAALLAAYLNAAGDISRFAVGQPKAPQNSHTYRVLEIESQHQWERVEGAPYGTRGGIVVTQHFPADGNYSFNVTMYDGGQRAWFEDIDVTVDDQHLGTVPFPVVTGIGFGDFLQVGPFPVTAGEHRVAVTFTPTGDGPYEDLIRPYKGGHAGRGAAGTTGLPHLKELTIAGPYDAAGASDNPVRERIFTCRPATPAEARPCAERIIRPIATRAYRRPVDATDVGDLLRFYDQGEKQGGFEAGVRNMIEAVLSSPSFVFRLEREPAEVAPGTSYRVSDLDLASRLSFFLWGTVPDEELLKVASEGRLSNTKVLEQQARRMLEDPRSEALGDRFAAQWLRLQDMSKTMPDLFWYPDYTKQIELEMRRETEMFFNNLVREDRPLFELYNANYSFMNEHLATHYGIRGVLGSDFRKVVYPEGFGRIGVVGQGSILLLTSMGNRTSPVLRGKWVMEVLLGTPPPPPPPAVPALEATSVETPSGKILTGRERLAAHSASPVCKACHVYMDPIGVALEGFDIDGTTRLKERGMNLPVDSKGTLYDGTAITNEPDLMKALLSRPIPLMRTFTTNLMAYSLGRRVEYFDQPAIRKVVADAAKDDYKISAFILGVVKSEQFRTRTKAAEATQ